MDASNLYANMLHHTKEIKYTRNRRMLGREEERMIHSNYASNDIKGLDEIDKRKAFNKLMNKLDEAEKSISEYGTISADELEHELGV